jgi:ABC-type uncharacterized transport system ATPase subunit
MRIAFGALAPDAGRVTVRGRERRFRSSADAIEAGVGMVHQHFKLIPALSVLENAALGGRGLLRAHDAHARLRALAERIGFLVDPNTRVSELSVSAQQRVEILKALSHDADLLILDEPTAVLTPDEATSLLAWVRRFVADGGTAILVTHKLREALRFADDVTVLRRGVTTLSTTVAATDEGALVSALTGDPHGAIAPPVTPTVPATGRSGSPVLALDQVSFVDERGVMRLRDASLSVHAGEVVGVLGVEGSGHRELLRLLAGRLDPTRGTVSSTGRVGFVPEDRLGDALIGTFSLTENVALAEAGRASGRLDWRAMRARTDRLLADAEVLSSGPAARAFTLSGGNQQKFVVARERTVADRAIVAEHPTRGLDIRASARVMDDLREAAFARGMAVVVHSPDMDEVLAIATRVVVCFAGTLREVPRPPDPLDRTPFARALVGAL